MGGFALVNSNDQNGVDDIQSASLRILGIKVSVWFGFALGVFGTVLIVHMLVLRPLTRQLEHLQDRIGSLEWSVHEVAGEKDSVETTNGLLATLVQQREKVVDATEAFDELCASVRTLQDGAYCANESLRKMIALQDCLSDQQETVTDAQETLDSLVELKDRTLYQGDGIQSAQRIVTQWDALYARLARSSEMTNDARQATDDLVDLQSELLCRAGDVDAARTALDDLLDIRKTLQTQGDHIQMASSRIDEFVALKDGVLAQSGDIADAIETLEITDDLHAQINESAIITHDMRRDLAELMILAPTFERAMQTLKPLTELGNLRRLDRDDLQELASTIIQQRKSQLSSRPEVRKPIWAAKSGTSERLPLATATLSDNE